jgi:branched-chain amino acid transport system ATP-binding protein
MTTKTLLSLTDVRSGYGRVSVINRISFDIKKSEILAVIGRNGVGKSTLMKTIIGEIPTFSGKIILGEQEIQKLPASQRAQGGIGYVPQGRGLFNGLTVSDNLRLGKLVGGKPNKINYDRVFEFFPVLKERLNQVAGTLSGGQQQQLAFGRILIGNPDIVLLDEPSEGIQPNIVQAIGEVIRRIRDMEGLTVIIVEQNLDLIQASADRCVVIDKGTIIADIAPKDLMDPEISKKYLAI